MEKKNINWSDLGFEYQQTELRYVSNYKDGAWDEGGLTSDANVVINECAGVLQYAQTVFEGRRPNRHFPSGSQRGASHRFFRETGNSGNH